MKFLFFNPDGNAVSGVFTYGKLLLAHHPDCLIVSLNDDSPPAFDEAPDRHFRVPFDRSHDAGEVALVIEDIARRFPEEPLILLPNNGVVSFLACLHAMENASQPQRFRILAIVHSDHPNSYAMPLSHAGEVATFAGVSRTISDQLKTALADRQEDVFHLPLPVQIPKTGSRTFFDMETPLRLLYAGRLDEEQKRVSRLPRVARHLTDLGIPFRLDIFGEGSERERLGESFGGAAPEGTVRLMGTVSAGEMRERMGHYDILLLTSAYEGTPLALLEGMAAGLCPVVMKIDSGLSGVLEEGANGFIVPQGETRRMAEAIAALHGDRPRLDAMKRAARERIEARHSIAQHLELFDRIAISSLGAPPRAPADISSPFDEPIARLLATLERDAAPVAVWGGGMFGRCLVDACLREGVRPFAIFDRDPAKQGRDYRDIPYLAPERITLERASQVLIGSMAYTDQIERQIRELFEREALPVPRIVGCGEQTA